MSKAFTSTVEKWMCSCTISAPALKAIVLPKQVLVVRCQDIIT